MNLAEVHAVVPSFEMNDESLFGREHCRRIIFPHLKETGCIKAVGFNTVCILLFPIWNVPGKSSLPNALCLKCAFCLLLFLFLAVFPLKISDV